MKTPCKFLENASLFSVTLRSDSLEKELCYRDTVDATKAVKVLCTMASDAEEDIGVNVDFFFCVDFKDMKRPNPRPFRMQLDLIARNDGKVVGCYADAVFDGFGPLLAETCACYMANRDGTIPEGTRLVAAMILEFADFSALLTPRMASMGCTPTF